MDTGWDLAGNEFFKTVRAWQVIDFWVEIRGLALSRRTFNFGKFRSYRTSHWFIMNIFQWKLMMSPSSKSTIESIRSFTYVLSEFHTLAILRHFSMMLFNNIFDILVVAKTLSQWVKALSDVRVFRQGPKYIQFSLNSKFNSWPGAHFQAQDPIAAELATDLYMVTWT